MFVSTGDLCGPSFPLPLSLSLFLFLTPSLYFFFSLSLSLTHLINSLSLSLPLPLTPHLFLTLPLSSSLSLSLSSPPPLSLFVCLSVLESAVWSDSCCKLEKKNKKLVYIWVEQSFFFFCSITLVTLWRVFKSDWMQTSEVEILRSTRRKAKRSNRFFNGKVKETKQKFWRTFENLICIQILLFGTSSQCYIW